MNRKLSLENKFGQMILLGLDVYDINEEIVKIIKEYHIGGVVLYKKNYTSIDTMMSFINRLKSINKEGIPLFIAIDQENGRVNRLPKDVERMYNVLKLADTKNMKVIDEVNKITTYLLKNLGINMNFAPVLDIYRSENNKVIGNRSYGRNIEDVIRFGLPFMKEMQKNNIISVIKHFPGHGITTKDSHFVLPKIRNVELLEKEDVQVFYKAIEQGADAVMVSHLKIKGYGKNAASVNKNIINDYLINKKYNGLIVTDDLRMNSLRLFKRTKNNIKKSIEAGSNVIMIKYQKGDYKLYNKLFKMVKNCEIDLDCIDNSAKKILEYKKNYKISNNLIDNTLDLEKINKRIRLINEYVDKLEKV